MSEAELAAFQEALIERLLAGDPPELWDDDAFVPFAKILEDLDERALAAAQAALRKWVRRG